jgi:hypothetical protein
MSFADMTENKDYFITLTESCFQHNIEDMKEFLAKYPTEIKKKEYKDNMNHILKIYNTEIENNDKIIQKEIKPKINAKMQFKQQILQYIEGKYKSVEVINMPIDFFSNEQLETLFQKGNITETVFKNETDWRKFKTDYPTLENKLEYIKKIDEEIAELKNDIKQNIDKSHSINLMKEKVKMKKHLAIYYEEYDNMYKKYILDEKQYSTEEQKPVVMMENEPPVVMMKNEPPVVEKSSSTARPTALDFIDSYRDAHRDTHRDAHNDAHRDIGESHSVLRSYSNSPSPSLVNSKVKYCGEPYPTILLEHFCHYGFNCINYNNPLKCSYNHSEHYFENAINKGEYIPANVCIYEKPWLNARCKNIHCTFWHFAGRVNYIKKYIEHNPDILETREKRKCKDEDDIFPKRPRLNTREVRTYLNIKRE